MDKKIVRFLLTWFLGWIGCVIINHSNLRPEGYKCRTGAYFWLTPLTCGIYPMVASICNISFTAGEKNIGYKMKPVPVPEVVAE